MRGKRAIGIDTKASTKVQNKLVGQFMMAVVDVISVWEQILKQSYIPTEIFPQNGDIFTKVL